MLHTQNWNDLVSTEHSEKMQKVLDSSVDQIAGVISCFIKIFSNLMFIIIQECHLQNYC